MITSLTAKTDLYGISTKPSFAERLCASFESEFGSTTRNSNLPLFSSIMMSFNLPISSPRFVTTRFPPSCRAIMNFRVVGMILRKGEEYLKLLVDISPACRKDRTKIGSPPRENCRKTCFQESQNAPEKSAVQCLQRTTARFISVLNTSRRLKPAGLEMHLRSKFRTKSSTAKEGPFLGSPFSSGFRG